MTEQQPTYNQLNEQYTKPDGTAPSVLVPMPKGDIGVGNVVGEEGSYVTISTRQPNSDGTTAVKLTNMPKSEVSDQRQNEMAAILGGASQGAESARVHEISDEEAEKIGEPAVDEALGIQDIKAQLFDGLSESAKSEVLTLNATERSQRQAHNDGDWGGSKYLKQDAYEQRKKLSPEAKAYYEKLYSLK